MAAKPAAPLIPIFSLVSDPMADISNSEMKRLLDPFKRGKNLVILEIGANSGMDTKVLMQLARNAHVHCFECDPRAIARWRTIVKSSRATLYEVALSDKTGEAEFHPSGGNPGGRWENYGQWDMSGSLLPFDRHKDNAPWMKYLDPIKVQTTTLDEWAAKTLPDNYVCPLIWIDVQGAEAIVFRSGVETLKHVHYVFAECDPRPNYKGQATRDELAESLPEFELVREYPGYNLLFKNTDVVVPSKH